MNFTLTAIIIAGCVFLTTLGVGKAITEISNMVTEAAASARAERDAHWQAEIARSNEAVAKAEAQRAEQVASVNADAEDRIALAERQVLELRKDNDALPDDGSCGLSAGRVELLNR